ncbi:SDR family oxidoreductase [Spongisporangium articulatum]|uniref:SDR family oxidoreductase n=1 Tax=Spongisporangium articulatum TaxID=3362603 RepID=A0ABW8ATR9_9ACTN
MPDLYGRVALVTGGTRGVGLGVARALHAAGADVVVCGRNRPEALPEGFEFRAVDVRDPEAATALVRGVAVDHGRLDVLVNNAGGAPYALAADASPRFHASVVTLNLLAPLALSQAANAVMQEQPDGGSIVMISSVSGTRPSPGTAAYGAAKAGLNSLATSLAVEWAPRVRVNALVVGPVLTEQSALHYGDDEGVAAVGRTIPMGRLAYPDDVGGVCVFLASPAAAYVSGALIAVHGGGERPAFLGASNAQHQKESRHE